MKIVVGVDTIGLYRSAFHMCVRLGFRNPEFLLAHSVDLSGSMTAFGTTLEPSFGVEFARLANESGEQALQIARNEADDSGIKATTRLLEGGAAGCLADFADESGADLVCVHSERKGRLGSFFLGSVSRGLAISAKQSVLISKGNVPATGSLSLVFATDHSPYAQSALDKFVAMGASGVEHIAVVSALHLGQEDDVKSATSFPSVMQVLKSEALRQTNETVQKLNSAGYSCSGSLVDAPVNVAIEEAMKENGAELLVVGAQGHGFMHRIVLGSTALHQAVVEPYSVLVIRV